MVKGAKMELNVMFFTGVHFHINKVRLKQLLRKWSKSMCENQSDEEMMRFGNLLIRNQ